MQGPEVSRVGELVLVWLLTRADGKGARSGVGSALRQDRVFISRVWRALGDPPLEERAFKQRLLSANQQRLLNLSRADMVEWMNPQDVSSSEIRYLGSTFHFIAL